ncbi:hypothetical protein DQM68_07430 [Leptospira mayottensis]|uniref:Uncharacterized protein n=1 Tax=Leptospira mayottensis TaxID=1137606 RepID=A0ABM6YD46_9LEPT|nr:hypothetical protein DQM68_07430 [Leptospira mayottensis]AXR66104.1 hypothetical protein DQM28_09115 [Leptospira mayottensis]AXR68067.1 hypothetical protein DPV73_08605 [Leptospira mayottensis]AZQ03860.1 hypothetical protein LEP1GSC190_14255 [Leptospira mayottensis 200901116]TGN17050.1 hypothetical protein EHR03_02810 [Leptospira mayottensis]
MIGYFSFWKVSILRISSRRNHNIARLIEPNLSYLRFSFERFPKLQVCFGSVFIGFLRFRLIIIKF